MTRTPLKKEGGAYNPHPLPGHPLQLWKRAVKGGKGGVAACVHTF